jgi:comEA protein
MTHGDNCFLFTGDAEEPSEHTVVQKGLEPCEVLKVAHHGSNHSSSMHFLNAVQPKYALISLGVDNKYGHPGEETLSRLDRVGAQVYRTDTQGTIKVLSDGKSLTFSTSKKAPPQSQKSTSQQMADIDHDMMEQHPDPASSSQSLSGKFDLNSATQSQLESIPGIGPSKASAIIAYRNEHGPFSSIQETQKVSGVGEKTAAKIAEYAFVQ